MNITFQRVCAWSGVICLVLFFGAFVFAGFIPPLPPAMPAADVVTHYQQHTMGIRTGMALMFVSTIFYAFLVGVISGQMRRIPGISPTLRYVQLCAGSFGLIGFIVPAMLFMITAFRPERTPELTVLMNDVSWIMLVMPWPPFMAHYLAFAVAILSDKRAEPAFPRWFGYSSIWVASLFTPGTLLPFFKDGPFAWDGLLVFWLAAVVFTVWMCVVSYVLLRAVNQEAAEAKAS